MHISELPVNQPVVYVLESNHSDEVSQGLSEGRALYEMLRFSRVPVQYVAVVDKADLRAQLFWCGLRRLGKDDSETPIIHIAAHGNNDGICLTSSEFVAWPEFAVALKEINRITKGYFLLAMSCCNGLAALKAIAQLPEVPLGVVSTPHKVDWADNVIGFSTLYHLLNKNRSIGDSVKAMNIASGHGHYEFCYGPDWMEFVKAYLAGLVGNSTEQKG